MCWMFPGVSLQNFNRVLGLRVVSYVIWMFRVSHHQILGFWVCVLLVMCWMFRVSLERILGFWVACLLVMCWMFRVPCKF
jgi:hypothetical protein